MDDHTRLEKAITHLESQRENLGDAVVDAALIPLQEKVAEIVARGDFPEQQRKQATILFTDIVGSTRVASHLDPEDTRDIFDNALQRLAQPVEGHNGHVTRFMGDGFKAVFGTPQAHENDPEQAVRAGLGILEVAQKLALELEQQWQIQDFQVRVGINTGLVAVGGTTEAEDTLMGGPVNLATRIESAAPSGGILISQNTYRHVRGIFDVHQLEPITAKGFDQPIPVYLVKRPKARSLRIYLRGVEGIETRMVGRDSELKLLQDAFHKTIEEGKGQVITTTGEAGIGKSRLIYEFDKWLELIPPPTAFIFQGRGRSDSQEQPYAMLREMFTFRFEILDSDPSEVVLHKLEAGFGEIFGTDQAGQRRAHLICQLLGFDCSRSPYIKGVLDDPKLLRELATDFLIEYFIGLTVANPAVLFLEDMHWVDDSSLDLIIQLAQQTPRTRLLILCLARETFFERYPSWGEEGDYHTRQDLQPLNMYKSRQLVDEILQKVEQIPELLLEMVVGSAEGNPFYIEELIKMLIETGVILKGDEFWWVKQERLAQVEVPPTLTGVLQARLDSLPAFERRVLQLAAVIGKEFWDGALHKISEASGFFEEDDLETQTKISLASLRGRELIYGRDESTFSGNLEYSFKHILFRDVTYQTILKRERRVYHRLSADWLVEVTQASHRSAEYAALIADHYLFAEQRDLASDWYFRAGLRAKSQVAMKEARRFLTQALELLPPDDLENRWRVIFERDEILGVLRDIEGRKSDDQALINIAQDLNDDKKLAHAYYRLGFFYNSRGQYKNELDAYEKALSAARRAADRQVETLILGLKVVCLSFLGEMELAHETADTVLSYARELNDDYTLAKTLGNVFIYYQSVDISKAVELVEESIELLDRLGEHNLKATSMVNLGYIYTQTGYYEQGERTFERSLDLSTDLENPRLIAYNQLNLGLTYFRLKDYQMARDYLEKTLKDTMQINDTFAHAACQSYLGLTMEGSGEYDQAKKYFSEALETFNEIAACGYAMDTMASLSRCAIEAGKMDEAKVYTDQVCDYLRQHGSQGMEFPVWAYVTCAQVFEEDGDDERMQQSIEDGYRELMERAEKIGDPEWRKTYLEEVPEHNELLALWQHLRNEIE